jgi:hypothetical protein
LGQQKRQHSWRTPKKLNFILLFSQAASQAEKLLELARVGKECSNHVALLHLSHITLQSHRVFNSFSLAAAKFSSTD